VTNEIETAEAPAEGESAAATESWRQALASRRTELAEPESVPATQAAPIDYDASRRNFIRTSFWTGLGITIMGGVGLFVDFIYPRNVKGFGGPVPAGNVADYPVGGTPVHNLAGQFWIANLDPSDTTDSGADGAAGLMAIWRKCPHLGCTVPWKADARVEISADPSWYQCPCHGSTFTRTGVRVFGPAPRSMDTMQIDIDDAGNITIQTGAITSGGPDNPERAVQHPLLPS
jgi:cytochrome b6-f complex iron-sulfur subunit